MLNSVKDKKSSTKATKFLLTKNDLDMQVILQSTGGLPAAIGYHARLFAGAKIGDKISIIAVNREGDNLLILTTIKDG